MDDNKKIAINTIVLTVKLLITMVCSFVVSRFVLHALGADDYGLYNVVGGIVSLLALISSSMIATSYRYIAVERGKGTKGDLQKIYSTLMFIHFVLAVFLIVIGLPTGLFYINNYLTISSASVSDANFVFVFSLIATFFSILAVPSNGLLVAEEKFVPIAIIGIVQSLLNVVMAIILLHYSGNRICLYAFLMALLNVANRIAFHFYCLYKYPRIVKFKFNHNIHDYKSITFFTGWMLIGASSYVGRSQGVALIINVFFRNSINAAFGIACQVGNAVSQFTNTLRQSVTPQIMKNQESNSDRSLSLVYVISRYTFLIMLVIVVPTILCMDTILDLWLGSDNIPPFTSIFTIILLIDGMISNLRSGFDASIQASGNVRKNQIGYTVINLSILPIIYVLYQIGFPAYTSVIIGGLLSIITIFFQAYIMKELTSFTYKDYVNKTILPTLIPAILSFVPLVFIRMFLKNEIPIVFMFFVTSVLWTCAVVFFTGINSHEQYFIRDVVKKVYLKYCRL